MSRASRRRQPELPQAPGAHSDRIDSVNAVIHSPEYSAYAGPLPHPDILRSFEEIVLGSASLIFKQFEEQSVHRRLMEATVISSGAFSQRIGSISASVIGFIGVAGGLWLAHEGQSIIGLSALFGTLATLVGTFVYKRKQQDLEREGKRQGNIKERK